jgi:hypothetical protein
VKAEKIIPSEPVRPIGGEHPSWCFFISDWGIHFLLRHNFPGNFRRFWMETEDGTVAEGNINYEAAEEA